MAARLSAASFKQLTMAMRWTGKGMTMSKIIYLASTAIVGAAMLAPPVLAQGTPQTITLMKVDPQTLATGFRVSKVLGATVLNEASEKVGTIDDLIVTPTQNVPYAVLSVGGFLGMGTRLVVVPYDKMKTSDKNMLLPGATRDSLKKLPEFKYAE
jgi:sporulation protein YlmC with PRC-barrel domain